MELTSDAAASLLRVRGVENKDLNLKGKFVCELIRLDGTKELIDIENAVTNEGKNLLFNVMFHSTTAITTWYIGLINGDGSFSTTAVTDTMSSHAGWAEFGLSSGTGYSQSTRVSWGPDAAASQAISNTTAATFDIITSGTLRGVFISTNSTKGGTTGTLWSSALFTSSLSVSNGDQIKITYTVSA